jgi:hypothetical protein
MTSFNEWLEQRDERIYNEMFEKDAPLDLPDTNGQGLVNIRWNSNMDCMELYLNPEGKRYLGSKSSKMFGAGGPSLLKVIDQIGKSIGGEYFANIDSMTKGTGKINLGQLENDIRDGLQGGGSQRGNNAFMRSVLNIAYQYGLKVVPNTSGTGMMVMSMTAAKRDAERGDLQASNPSLHAGDKDEQKRRMTNKRDALAKGRGQLAGVEGRQKLGKPDPFGGTRITF